MRSVSRRAVLVAGGALPLALAAGRASAAPPDAGTGAATPRRKGAMQTRKIPRTGEALPVIGMGTWQTFDVSTEAERRPLKDVLARFFAAGGRVIDSSPMYGRAESVVGDLVAEIGAKGKPFLATKVWTTGKERGIEQMNDSLRKMGTDRMDLMQVHNLQDWRTHLETLRAWKEAGRVRYIGITHYSRGAFDEMEKIIREEKVDFVQLPYSIAAREVEARLLPAALDTGTAVLVMRPFEGGNLFARTKGRPIPEFARDFGCETWAQYFLKFLLGHPAVTCPIPATSKPHHVEDNLSAGYGRFPEDPALRKRMVEHLGL